MPAKKPLTKEEQEEIVLKAIKTGVENAQLNSTIHANREVERKVTFADTLDALARLTSKGKIFATSLNSHAGYYKPTNFLNTPDTNVTDEPAEAPAAPPSKRGRPPKTQTNDSSVKPSDAGLTMQHTAKAIIHDAETLSKSFTVNPKERQPVNPTNAQVVTEPIIKLEPSTTYTLTINERSFGPFTYTETWNGLKHYTSQDSEIVVIDNPNDWLHKIWGFNAEIEQSRVKIINASPDIAKAIQQAYDGAEETTV